MSCPTSCPMLCVFHGSKFAPEAEILDPCIVGKNGGKGVLDHAIV